MKNVYFLLLIISLIMSGSAIGITVVNGMSQEKATITQIRYNQNCENETLINTANCLKEELSQFYKYNITNYAKTISEKQLKEQGGACVQFSEWYIKKAKSLNYIAETIDIDMEKSKHEIAIISDNTGYCILDQLNINCHEVKI